MTAEPDAIQFDRTQSIQALKALYRRLIPPSAESLLGVHRGSIIGPNAMRALSRPSLVLSRLGGWWGKRFDTPEQGLNIVQRRGRFRTKLPMLLEERPSLIDGLPSLVIVYPPASPWPWPWIVDEVRRVDERTCLGITVAEKPVTLTLFAFALDASEIDPIP